MTPIDWQIMASRQPPHAHKEARALDLPQQRSGLPTGDGGEIHLKPVEKMRCPMRFRKRIALQDLKPGLYNGRSQSSPGSKSGSRARKDRWVGRGKRIEAINEGKGHRLYIRSE